MAFFFMTIRKVIHIVSLGCLVIYLIKLIYVLSLGLSQLTQYGYGYLTGALILILVFGFVAFKTKSKKPKKREI
ncbi:MAG: hypothetical protein WBN16_05540 [Lutimonas sp.]